MPTVSEQILELLQKSLSTEAIKQTWRDKLPALTEAQQTELLSILASEQKAVQEAIQTEQQKNAPQNQAIYRQLLTDMKNLAQTFKKTELKTVEKNSQNQDNDVLKSLEQELSNL